MLAACCPQKTLQVFTSLAATVCRQAHSQTAVDLGDVAEAMAPRAFGKNRLQTPTKKSQSKAAVVEKHETGSSAVVKAEPTLESKSKAVVLEKQEKKGSGAVVKAEPTLESEQPKDQLVLPCEPKTKIKDREGNRATFRVRITREEKDFLDELRKSGHGSLMCELVSQNRALKAHKQHLLERVRGVLMKIKQVYGPGAQTIQGHAGISVDELRESLVSE